MLNNSIKSKLKTARKLNIISWKFIIINSIQNHFGYSFRSGTDPNQLVTNQKYIIEIIPQNFPYFPGKQTDRRIND